MAKGIKMKGFKRGYTVMGVKKKLNLYGMGNAMYEVYEVTGPNVPSPKLFVDEASVHKYIELCEMSKIENRALAGKGFQAVKGVAALHKDIMAEKELPELQTEVPNDRQVAANKEDMDK